MKNLTGLVLSVLLFPLSASANEVLNWNYSLTNSGSINDFALFSETPEDYFDLVDYQNGNISIQSFDSSAKPFFYGTYTFLVTTEIDRTLDISFDWSYNLNSGTLTNNPFGYYLNEQEGLTLDGSTSGSQTLRLYSGDTFGFYIQSLGGSSSVDLSGVDVVSVVPEPSTLALMIGGIGLVGFFARKKIKR